MSASPRRPAAGLQLAESHALHHVCLPPPLFRQDKSSATQCCLMPFATFHPWPPVLCSRTRPSAPSVPSRTFGPAPQKPHCASKQSKPHSRRQRNKRRRSIAVGLRADWGPALVVWRHMVSFSFDGVNITHCAIRKRFDFRDKSQRARRCTTTSRVAAGQSGHAAPGALAFVPKIGSFLIAQ